MRNYFGQVPFGVWCGVVIVLVSVFTHYYLGLVLGGGLALATIAAVNRRDKNERP